MALFKTTVEIIYFQQRISMDVIVKGHSVERNQETMWVRSFQLFFCKAFDSNIAVTHYTRFGFNDLKAILPKRSQGAFLYSSTGH